MSCRLPDQKLASNVNPMYANVGGFLIAEVKEAAQGLLPGKMACCFAKLA
jgi:hypothetical protein